MKRGEFIFDIDIQFDDISITSIERDDILLVQNWLDFQSSFCIDIEEPFDKKEFYNRFIEYYVSECEFFLKIQSQGKVIGVMKGRVEFKNPNEVWISYFLLDRSVRCKGLGSAIFIRVSKYFDNSYGIHNIYISVAENDTRAIKFWLKNNFELKRVSKNFFNINGNATNMLILKNIKEN